MIAAMPPADAAPVVDVGAGAVPGAAVVARHTHPTLFAMMTSESSDMPTWPQRLTHCCPESDETDTFRTPTGAG